MRRPLSALCLALAIAAFAILLFGRLAYPLLWQDEGETAMFATRILEAGYPKVHGERNVLYEFGPNVALGVKESVDAYIGKTWGDFYFAVPGAWWARGVDDPRARTWRLRLPFALAGALGLGLLLWGVAGALPREHRIALAAVFVALCATSVSLLLHLREVRYYALLVLVLGAMLALHLRHFQLGSLRWRSYVVGQALLSFALFQVFYVAWFATTGLLALDAAHAVWRREAPSERASALGRAWAPHAAAALFVLPCLVFFETFSVASGFAEHLGISLAGYADNARFVLVHFARHEWGVAALVARCGVVLLRRVAGAEPGASDRVASRLAGFCVGYALIGCVNPLVYERYTVVLSPVVSLVFALDGFRAWALAAQLGPQRVRRARAASAVVLALLVFGTLIARREALAGRLAELADPVRGPVDFAVAHLRERYPDPSALVIATNYEAHPLMYYLGSRVVVGLSLNDILEERALVPDVVIPRRAWPRPLPELRRFLAKAEYEETTLPVLDTHYNNIPALSSSPATPDPHRFETPAAAPGTPGRLRVFHRSDRAAGGS